MPWKTLEIRVLGELAVLHDGRPAALPASKKTRAMLGYLAVTKRAHARERLCDLLWDTPDDPRAALRWTLWKLRPFVDGGRTQRLIADRERVSFEPRDADVDLSAVRALLHGGVADASTEALRAAAAHFRGELLEGIDLPDCYRFQEWCAGEREALRVLRARVLALLAERLASDPEAALAHARARVTIDPLDEDAHVQVIALLGRLGRVRDALRQYDVCRRMVEKELHARPSPRLEQARAGLGASAATLATRGSPVAPPPAPAATRSDLPFVGRAGERARIDAALAAVEAGGPRQLLLVVGEPGIGKSRLLQELGARVRQAGGLMLSGRAFEAERSRPYGPWVDALRADPTIPLSDDLAPLLAEPNPARAAATDRTRLHEAVARACERLAANRLLAIAIDDLQWLDDASIGLLHFIVRVARGRIVFAAAARSEELGDNASALRLIRDLGREERLCRVPLGPLDEAAIGDIVRAELARSGRPEAGVDVGRVSAESEGNPLFALEIARAELPSGGALPPSIERLIDERLAHLDDGARDLLPWLAAIGRSFRPETAARAAEIASGVLLASLQELERRAIVRATDGESYDFTHDLVRRVAYWRTAAPQRRIIHARLARVLAAAGDADGLSASEIARHADRGGESELCANACLRAGERCLQLFAFDEAEALAELGRRHADRLDPETRIALQMRLCGVLLHPGVRLRKPGNLAAEIASLAAEAQEAGLDAACSAAFQHLARLYYWSFRDLPRARAALLHAAELLSVLPAAGPNVEPLVEGARCLASLEVGIARAREMFANLAVIRGAAEMLGYQWGLGLLLRWEGDSDGARKALSAALALAQGAKKHWAEFETAATLAMLELESGSAARALSLSRQLRPLAERLGEGGSEGPLVEALEALARLKGGEPGAAAAVDAAARTLERIDSRYHLAYLLNSAAVMDLRAGRIAAAHSRAGAGLQAAAAVDRGAEIRRARLVLAIVAKREGCPDEARDHLVAAGSLDANELPAHARTLLMESC